MEDGGGLDSGLQLQYCNCLSIAELQRVRACRWSAWSSFSSNIWNLEMLDLDLLILKACTALAAVPSTTCAVLVRGNAMHGYAAALHVLSLVLVSACTPTTFRAF
jgi:hypothetical protein